MPNRVPRFALRIIGTATVLWDAPLYLKTYDPDAHGGQGYIEMTADAAEALTFPDFVTTMHCWTLTSTVRPRRDDGKPNRPLTAYTVEVARLDREEGDL